MPEDGLPSIEDWLVTFHSILLDGLELGREPLDVSVRSSVSDLWSFNFNLFTLTPNSTNHNSSGYYNNNFVFVTTKPLTVWSPCLLQVADFTPDGYLGRKQFSSHTFVCLIFWNLIGILFKDVILQLLILEAIGSNWWSHVIAFTSHWPSNVNVAWFWWEWKSSQWSTQRSLWTARFASLHLSNYGER